MACMSLKSKLISRSMLVGNSPYIPLALTGGTLTSDATYYYRTFTSSDTLGVTGGPVTADVLVIAGGGSGGVYRGGAGGGAGGLLYTASQSLATNTYVVTIGAASIAARSYTLNSNTSKGRVGR